MPTKAELKDKAFAEIDQRADELVALSKQILADPEPGFREFKTAGLVGDKFAQMGVPFRQRIGHDRFARGGDWRERRPYDGHYWRAG